MKKLLVSLFFVNCIVSGNLTICTDLETGKSWTILTTGY
jgi:hypothetical protein